MLKSWQQQESFQLQISLRGGIIDYWLLIIDYSLSAAHPGSVHTSAGSEERGNNLKQIGFDKNTIWLEPLEINTEN